MTKDLTLMQIYFEEGFSPQKALDITHEVCWDDFALECLSTENNLVYEQKTHELRALCRKLHDNNLKSQGYSCIEEDDLLDKLCVHTFINLYLMQIGELHEKAS
jgi:hypothetical protein